MARINLYNASGCVDPTAQAALEPIQREQDEADERASMIIHDMKLKLDQEGFDLIRRIEIRDRKTGREYK